MQIDYSTNASTIYLISASIRLQKNLFYVPYQNQLVFGRRVQIEFNRFNTTRQYAPSTHCKEFKELEKEKTRREIENFQVFEREVQRNNGKSLHR